MISNDPNQRELGSQPLSSIMTALSLKAHDLVSGSDVQITHKMISKAIKGRRLSSRVKAKIQNALNAVTSKTYRMEDLFNY